VRRTWHSVKDAVHHCKQQCQIDVRREYGAETKRPSMIFKRTNKINWLA
jgi:hypothetical protein